MAVDALIDDLRQAGIGLSTDGVRLRVTAPKGAMTPALQSRIRAHKAELLEALRPAAPVVASTPVAVDADEPLPPIAEVLAGRRIAITGATGFVGKAFVSRLLAIAPDLAGAHLLVRGRGRARDAARRVRDEIACSPALAGVARGADDARLVAHTARIDQPRFGLDEAAFAALADRIDLVVHVAGVVDLSPPLGHALSVNVDGARHAVGLARRAGAPLVHVSTCYVSGLMSGRIPEALAVGAAPSGAPGFDVDAELTACRAEIARARQVADDPATRARLRAPGDSELKVRGRAQEHARQALARWARERAAAWGYPNVYTYTKGLAEQVVAQAAADGLSATVFRPSILESAHRHPEPGWNQSANTSAPLAFLARQGHALVPAGPDAILDVLPVDMAAGAMVAVCAAALSGRAAAVYQAASGDTNALELRRVVELTELYYRLRGERPPRGWARALKALAASTTTVPRSTYDRASAPGVRRALEAVRDRLDTAASRSGDGPVGRLHRRLDEAARTTREVEGVFDEYMVVLDGARAIYETKATRALRGRLQPEDRAAIGFEPEALDWRAYWLDAHLPGVEAHCFPELERQVAAARANAAGPARRWITRADGGPQPPHAASLIMLLRDAVARDPSHAMLDDRPADAVAAAVVGAAEVLAADGVGSGDRVCLVAHNSADWVVAYFGAVLAGAVVVPLDPALDDATIAALADRAGARCVIADRPLEGAMALDALAEARTPNALARLDAYPHDPSRPASLLYTSGTTGARKGVRLSHGGLCAQVASLTARFGLGPDEHALSVLPLHHVLEFTCGLLFPIALGARVTYLEDRSPEGLRAALADVRPTALVAVPALLDALMRGVRDRAGRAEPLFERALATSRWAREQLGVEVGGALFAPAHAALGGRLRMVVCGGAPLSEATFDALRGLGVQVYEGYGLTETSPVVATWGRADTPTAGAVGRPLPGVEVRLAGARSDGAGEIEVRGPGVMLGYDGDAAATAAALDADGWFRTGDLGRIDPSGVVSLCGRIKDVIVDPSGHTLHPDELEERLAGIDGVEELCVARVILAAGGEAPGAVVRLSADGDAAAVRAEIARRDAERPAYTRMRRVVFHEAPLPRSATRKVKRAEVAEMLAGAITLPESTGDTSEAVRALIERAAGRACGALPGDARLVEDVGLDSLALASLTHRIAGQGAPRTVADVASRLGGAAPAGQPRTVQPTPRGLPEPLRAWGRRLLGAAQRAAHAELLDCQVLGETHIPWHTPSIIVANHCSHLDVGLLRTALGTYAREAVAVAAKDYFYATPARRFWFENFTHSAPIDRERPSTDPLDGLVEVLRGGRSLIFFPEGTRSTDGALGPFRPGVGYLALHAGVPVLPVHLDGTHAALPKGALLPRGREVTVRIGAALEPDALAALAEGRSRANAYRAVAEAVRAAVARLGAVS